MEWQFPSMVLVRGALNTPSSAALSQENPQRSALSSPSSPSSAMPPSFPEHAREQRLRQYAEMWLSGRGAAAPVRARAGKPPPDASSPVARKLDWKAGIAATEKAPNSSTQMNTDMEGGVVVMLDISEHMRDAGLRGNTPGDLKHSISSIVADALRVEHSRVLFLFTPTT
jgi:hypothetical protein